VPAKAAVAAALLLALPPLAAQAEPLRSRALHAEFQRLNPCPATGEPRGACPGYEVDHRAALICGGRDELQNLQWLTVAEHREKTKVEVKLCRGRTRRAPTRDVVLGHPLDKRNPEVSMHIASCYISCP
jgi:hypothetical protein